MEHSFDIQIAKEYGVQAAVILKNIYFWIEKNRANETNFFDDTYWTFNSKKAFAELFPYMTSRQIDYALQKLIDDGILKTGNYNKAAYDRTLWYAITKKGYCILQNCEMEKTNLSNGNDEIVEPIPDINSNPKLKIKTQIEYIVSRLNERTGQHYRTSAKDTQRVISARLKDGFTVDDFYTVIDKKVADWQGTEFEQYLRPATLFGTKFESYLNAPANKRQTVGANGVKIAAEQINDLDDIF